VTSPMVADMLEVFFSRRAGCFNGNNVRKRPKNSDIITSDAHAITDLLMLMCDSDDCVLKIGLKTWINFHFLTKWFYTLVAKVN
jgi:hypothetical protein